MTEGFSGFAENIYKQKYSWKDANGTPTESWADIASRVASSVLKPVPYLVEPIEKLIRDRKFIPGGRYLYAAGRPFHQVNNCFLYRAGDSREDWAELLRKSSMSLMSGGGIGVDYSAVRPEGTPIRKVGGIASGPLALMQMLNEIGRHVMQGGSRRSAIWAGLRWSHKDIYKFIALKNWTPEVLELKAKNYNFPATMDMTNISVILDKEFFDAFDRGDTHAKAVYYAVCKRMFKTAEPGFSVDYVDQTESLRNACTEITSSDDSDVCNLGSVNMARISDLAEFREVVGLATRFLILGTLYSDIPHPEVETTRSTNRRIGLGLMGIHEWLIKRSYGYEAVPELCEWLDTYRRETDSIAESFSQSLGISTPIKRRAIAPTGTIGIIGETTTGIEPIYAKAFKRRYLKGKQWVYEYVIDPTVERLIQCGIPEGNIASAHSLGLTLPGFEQRIKFQADVQRYIDHGISSTINIAKWGTPTNNEDNVIQRADILYKYLPRLRGITCYADGSRGGQPITEVDYTTAKNFRGAIHYEQADVCDLTSGGTCGS